MTLRARCVRAAQRLNVLGGRWAGMHSEAEGGCAFTDFEHQRWQGAVQPYDRVFGPLTKQAARHLVQRACQKKGPGLDFATGPGYVIEEALRQGLPGAHLVGVDFSTAMLARAQKRLTDRTLRWIEADIQEPLLPEFRGKFAWCTCNFGVLHLARPEDFFRVALQALQPGGVFLFTVWAELAKSPGFQIPLRAIEEHGRLDVGLPPGPPFFQFSDRNIAQKALEAAGFAPQSVTSELLDLEWVLQSPSDLWEGFLDGTARTGGMLERQAPAAKEKIQAAMHDALVASQHQAGRTQPPYILNQPCVVVRAVAPG